MSVRVRFAPSPTGRPHMGNMRTALFNWLYARHQGGTFVLRIEDTDQQRQVPGAVEAICEGLRWLGLGWDEGFDKEGAYGPYVQSERLDLYQRHARQLVEDGQAYLCYCSPQRLERMRQAQIARGQPPGYDGRCRTLTAAQRARLEARASHEVVRFKGPKEGQTLVSDLVFHDLVFENGALDDAVLLKSDGFPTYHLAHVVDDHYMAITHVIRGDEWLPSTPRHLMLYQAFGWEPPRYAHLPTIVGPSGAKLSKRSDDVSSDAPNDASLDAYRERGYLAPAVVNHLALLGWSPRGKRELLTLEELAERFDLGRVSRSPSLFDVKRLNWFNRRYLRKLSEEEVTALLVPYWQEAYGVADRASGTAFNTPLEWQRTLALAVREELDYLGQVADRVRFAFVDEVQGEPEAHQALAQSYAVEVLRAFIQGLPAVEPFTFQAIDAFVSDLRLRFKRSHAIRSRDVMYVIRAALTGQLRGPCLVVACQLLGRQRCIERARAALP